jgi:hypothetical protein
LEFNMITPSYSITATERVLPKLALDFTTASLDPRVTFTRATSASNPATYTASTGFITLATNNQPRFDYDPITLVCKGLLIEESRTNLITYSAEFNNAAWVKSNLTVTANSTTSPDGAATADTLTVSAGSSVKFIRISSFPAIAAGTDISGSVYLKAGTSNFFSISITNTANNNTFAVATVDLSTGTVTKTGIGSNGVSVIKSSSCISVGNGWFRVNLTATYPFGSNAVLWVYANSSATPTYDVTSFGGETWNAAGTETCYVWGAQLEQASFPTSYIPTEAATLTRNADVATMTGTNFSDWYSAGAGGVVARMLPSTVSSIRPALQFDDTTANEIITLQGNTTNPELVIVDGGSPQAQIDAGTIAANTAYNLGAAWNTDNCAAAVNGGAAVTDNTATIPTVTQARIGSNGTNYLNGHIQTIRYWPQRIINAEVQAFSK